MRTKSHFGPSEFQNLLLLCVCFRDDIRFGYVVLMVAIGFEFCSFIVQRSCSRGAQNRDGWLDGCGASRTQPQTGLGGFGVRGHDGRRGARRSGRRCGCRKRRRLSFLRASARLVLSSKLLRLRSFNIRGLNKICRNILASILRYLWIHLGGSDCDAVFFFVI